ncbi:hypothetical protein OSTOST_08815 [Ostertagia ostertagi]
MGSCLCKEKTRHNHESGSSRGSRGCRRSEERNRSPHSFEQELDFDAGLLVLQNSGVDINSNSSDV